MKTIDTIGEKVLLISDIHQDIDWVEKVLFQESPDRVIWMGDWFDSHKPVDKIFGARQTAKWLKERIENNPKDVFLFGNHDFPYYEVAPACRRHTNKRHIYTYCSGFTNSKAKEINKELTEEHWQRFLPFCFVNNEYVISHAGISSHWWPVANTDDIPTLAFVYDKAMTAVVNARSYPMDILDAGLARGGNAVVGGFTWLDWDEEFTDEIPFAQIVGHTANHNHIRQRGRSFCIDGGQHTYAYFQKDGELRLTSITTPFKYTKYDKIEPFQKIEIKEHYINDFVS